LAELPSLARSAFNLSGGVVTMAKGKLTPVQRELLGLLATGPRYGFTNMATINSLVRKGLARKKPSRNTYGQKSTDWVITAKGRKLLPPPRKFDQSTSQDTPGFVETFRVHHG
jgi:hypothetical protein